MGREKIVNVKRRMRKDFTLSKQSIVVLEQLKSIQGFGSLSGIVEELIIREGLQNGILEAKGSHSLYEGSSTEIVYSEKQTELERQLSGVNRRIAELSYECKMYKNDLEKMLYQIRDMLNSELTYSVPDNADFASADPSDKACAPHAFAKQSEENYENKQRKIDLIRKAAHGGGEK